MQKYVFKTNIHIVNAIAVIFIIALYFLITMIEERTSNYLLLVFAVVAIFNFANSILTFYEFNEERLVLKSLTRKIVIYFSEVECIALQPAGKLVSLSIGIYAKGKKISITPWTNNYIELLGLIVNKCKEKMVNIDPRVLEVIKKTKKCKMDNECGGYL